MSEVAKTATLAVLAGGEGRRMGRPKGELTVGGRPILARLLDRLAWPGPTLLVTAPGRERPPGHERFDAEAVDAAPDEGPLRGLLTALDAATTPTLVLVPLDMPLLDAGPLLWLLERLAARPTAAGLMTSRSVDGESRVEPLPAAFRVAAARPRVAAHLAAGRRALHRLADGVEVIVEPSPPEWSEAVWTNLNHPADLAAFEAAAERGMNR